MDVIIVTGAGCGIGYEVSRKLAMEGYHVVLNDIDPELCHAAVDKIASDGGTCTAMPGDASSYTYIQQMVREASGLGRLTGVVANAGLTMYGRFLDMREDQLDQLMDLNLKGTFFLIQATARVMIDHGHGGRCVIMSSVTGVQAHEHLAAYGMTKGGLSMLARALVPELTPHGILINALAPGAVQTERTLDEDPRYAEKWGAIYPTGRTCMPADIAKACQFLISMNNEMINGQCIVVDGGWTTIGPMPPDIEFPT